MSPFPGRPRGSRRRSPAARRCAAETEPDAVPDVSASAHRAARGRRAGNRPGFRRRRDGSRRPSRERFPSPASLIVSDPSPRRVVVDRPLPDVVLQRSRSVVPPQRVERVAALWNVAHEKVPVASAIALRTTRRAPPQSSNSNSATAAPGTGRSRGSRTRPRIVDHGVDTGSKVMSSGRTSPSWIAATALLLASSRGHRP